MTEAARFVGSFLDEFGYPTSRPWRTRTGMEPTTNERPWGDTRSPAEDLGVREDASIDEIEAKRRLNAYVYRADHYLDRSPEFRAAMAQRARQSEAAAALREAAVERGSVAIP